MKLIFPLILILLISPFVYSQTKFDEYEATDSDSESSRIDTFVNALSQQPKSKGLIVVYAGEKLERIGNITAYIEGAEFYITEARGIKKDRISFIIGEGKTKLYKEFWILPEETKKPQIPIKEVNLDNLESKLFYATSCLECGPAVPALRNDRINLENYLKILQDNSTFQALVVIHRSGTDGGSAKDFVNKIKQLSNEKKINTKRIRIKFVRASKDALTTADLHISPEKKSKKN